MLTLVSAGLEHGMSHGLLKTVVSLILFLQISTVLMPHKDNKEQDIRLSMGILFILVGVMLYLHLELAFGAFLAGIFLPTFFDHKHELPQKLSSYGFGFFIPIFFIYIGSSFDLHSLLTKGLLLEAVAITAVMIVMRIISATVFIKSNGLKNSLLAFILASLFQVIIVMIIIKVMQIKKSA